MIRIPSWPTALGNFLRENASRPFNWAAWNCCSFAAAAIVAMTGTDISVDFTGYSDETSAWEKVKSVTGGTDAASILDYVSRKYELEPRKAPAFAQRGDLVLLSNPAQGQDATIVGIIGLHGQPMSVSDRGLITFPLSAVISAYKV